MKNICIYLFVLTLLESCTVYGLTNDYSKLNENQKNTIHSNNLNLENLEKKQIYVINAVQLKKELKKNEKSIVYIFTNGCTAKSCLPMSTFENYANKNGYKLYLIMSGYGRIEETLSQNFESSLFAIDYNYYNTKYRSNAWGKFENELRGNPINFKNKNYEGNIFFFNNDKLIKVSNDLLKE